MSESSTGKAGKYIIGVTGNIATGKSAVMRLAAEEGALVIDADKLVHEIMDQDPDMQASLAVAFGSDVRRPDGRINRRVLGEIVFADPDAMRDLEQMLHPAVYELVTQRIAESPVPLIFIEAIKLLEGRLAQTCRQVWVTRCSKQRQLERLRICRGMDTQTAAARIKAQSAQEDKVALADVVIDTNGYMSDTMRQFERAWDRLPKVVTSFAGAPVARSARPVVVPRPRTPGAPTVEPSATAKSGGSSARFGMPGHKKRDIESGGLRAGTVKTTPVTPAKPRPENIEVRRARPSDIPSIILLIQKATGGEIKMKRAELLMAFSERSYFIGQLESEINVIVGWNIDSQVASIDQIFIHPTGTADDVLLAIVEEIESSAQDHICEIVVAHVPEDAGEELRLLFGSLGYESIDKDSLPMVWQTDIDESRPDDSNFVVKIMRDERLNKAQSLR